MIHFHAAAGFVWTMAKFVDSWDRSLSEVVTVTPYSAIDPAAPVPAGLHVFTDFERLRGPERTFVNRLHDEMARHPESYAVLNDPGRWIGRLGLNQALSAAQVNDYRAFRLADVPSDLRFPAFVRWGDDHTGSLGDPVHSHDELRRRVTAEGRGAGRLRRGQLLVVEQVDVRGDDGLYRKYSAQRIGARLFPRHLFVSDEWVTKHSKIVDDRALAEEAEFLETFPHEAEVHAVFDLAGLDYGRIDYGFLHGRMQVWEINTNPVLAKRRKRIEPGRMPGQAASAVAMSAHLRELAAAAPEGPAQRLFGRTEALRWRAVQRGSRAYDRRRT